MSERPTDPARLICKYFRAIYKKTERYFMAQDISDHIYK